MPDPNCTICDGTGWRPIERGDLSAVERCECNQTARPAQLLEAARIPSHFERASFDNFRLPERQHNPVANDALSKAMLDAKVFAREFPATDKRGLLLMGLSGVGKTHLAVAVLRVLLERGFEGVFMDYHALLEQIRSGFDPASGAAAREAYQTALDTEVVLLDDLGAHRVTDFVEDTVTAIINHRYNAKKATLITTNLPDPAVGDVTASKDPASGKYMVKDTLTDRIGPRARSRLFEMCKLVHITATEDYRLKGIR